MIVRTTLARMTKPPRSNSRSPITLFFVLFFEVNPTTALPIVPPTRNIINPATPIKIAIIAISNNGQASQPISPMKNIVLSKISVHFSLAKITPPPYNLNFFST